MLADSYGRKGSIMLADAVFVAGALCMSLASSITVLVVGRFIAGVGIGISAMIVPVYIGESAPKEYRGALIATNGLFITGSQLVAYGICLACGDNWRLMLGLSGVPAAVQMIAMLFQPESPRYLLKIGRSEEAISVMLKSRKKEDNKSIYEEYRTILEEVSQEVDSPYYLKIAELFLVCKKAAIVGIGLQALQQLCGINTAMYYGPQIMQMIGLGSSAQDAIIFSIPLAAMNALGTIMSMILVDKLGRRGMLLKTLPIISLSMFMISIGMYVYIVDEKNWGGWAVLGLLCVYVATFAAGMGAVPWMVNSEIYPLYLRSVGNSLATTMNWTANFVVCMSFLSITASEVGLVGVWSIIGVFGGISWLWVYVLLPETMNMSLEEVYQLLGYTKAKSILIGRYADIQEIDNES